jgi:hypothetical protein
MRDFYANSARAPLDQADGLRRLFASRRCQLLPLASNAHVAFGASALDRLAAVLAARGREVLVVDAASTSPLPHELAHVDLQPCVEAIAPRVSYLAARGLPLAYVDTRGGAGGFIDAVQRAAPQADAIVLHADGIDLARLLKHRAARPLVIGADHPESIKLAYANVKLLVRRCGLMTFDLLLAASPQSPRLAAIAASLAGCAENFLGALLRHTAVLDPCGDPAAAPDAALAQLVAEQLALDDSASPLPTALPGTPASFADLGTRTTPARPAFSPAFR